ncbi:Regulator of nonsense transcripts 1-like [Hondaea fermentalgiana]|uniref:Regulator of nonsense transcripts 1-like n=1 Tax=Hondaea fermentalgiana TaxID=2315210 RepID=A0A2R5GG14_9STRA|nr:Regulator of nonsense transcripts 1-like [Hondaea fermentalgiana]|eukprot:GBG29846.1 Regulator of nonsense transcripts 1-like [Hondaea fermentalgiana]
MANDKVRFYDLSRQMDFDMDVGTILRQYKDSAEYDLIVLAQAPLIAPRTGGGGIPWIDELRSAGADFAHARPDFIFLTPQTGELLVVDAKSSSSLKFSHRVQVAVYSILLHDLLAFHRLDMDFSVAPYGGVWLPCESQSWGSILLHGPVRFNLSADLKSMRAFLSGSLGRILSSRHSENSLRWRLAPHCTSCDFLNSCRDTRDGALVGHAPHLPSECVTILEDMHDDAENLPLKDIEDLIPEDGGLRLARLNANLRDFRDVLENHTCKTRVGHGLLLTGFFDLSHGAEVLIIDAVARPDKLPQEPLVVSCRLRNSANYCSWSSGPDNSDSMSAFVNALFKMLQPSLHESKPLACVAWDSPALSLFTQILVKVAVSEAQRARSCNENAASEEEEADMLSKRASLLAWSIGDRSMLEDLPYTLPLEGKIFKLVSTGENKKVAGTYKALSKNCTFRADGDVTADLASKLATGDTFPQWYLVPATPIAWKQLLLTDDIDFMDTFPDSIPFSHGVASLQSTNRTTNPQTILVQIRGVMASGVQGQERWPEKDHVYFLVKRCVNFACKRLIQELEALSRGDPAGFITLCKNPAQWEASMPRLDLKVNKKRQFFDGLHASQRMAVENCLQRRMQVIWGPPGSGKTFTAARVVLEILNTDTPAPRVAIVMASTNSAINTCLSHIREACQTFGLKRVCIRQIASNSEQGEDGGFATVEPGNVKAKLWGNYDMTILGTTPWQLFKCPGIKENRNDCVATPGFATLLLIDEASQMHEAHAAIGLRALHPEWGRLVVVGDHKQLGPVDELDGPAARSFLDTCISQGVEDAIGKKLATKLLENLRMNTAMGKLLHGPYGHFSAEEAAAIRVDTVEKAQGQTFDLVLVLYGIQSHRAIAREATFIFDERRLNVAISRARYRTIVLAGENLTEVSPRALIDPVVQRGWAEMCRLRDFAAAAGSHSIENLGQ